MDDLRMRGKTIRLTCGTVIKARTYSDQNINCVTAMLAAYVPCMPSMPRNCG